ncbi:hypothetical protein DFH07DRAFT_2286 [Mycena maculata]|uniref:Uncharacterized protein n=1 Tax=Mycena maculata TaxID=230809 RepID=A0AAD7P2I3_9AGAR|nr:hypothetical protein DFH07DRAFT_2286 [Mycena maculata]
MSGTLGFFDDAEMLALDFPPLASQRAPSARASLLFWDPAFIPTLLELQRRRYVSLCTFRLKGENAVRTHYPSKAGAARHTPPAAPAPLRALLDWRLCSRASCVSSLGGSAGAYFPFRAFGIVAYGDSFLRRPDLSNTLVVARQRCSLPLPHFRCTAMLTGFRRPRVPFPRTMLSVPHARIFRASSAISIVQNWTGSSLIFLVLHPHAHVRYMGVICLGPRVCGAAVCGGWASDKRHRALLTCTSHVLQT